MLYPLKFRPIFKEKIWGGDKIKSVLKQDFSPLTHCGEAWEISGIEPESSIVRNGFLQGNSLNELIEVYMGELVGEKVFDVFGEEFPLLIKFIDAKYDLSVQVHPDDKLARKKHHSNGKTEMWYIIDAEPDAKLNIGFNMPMNKQLLQKHIADNTIEDVLQFVSVKAGDAVYIPSGKVHAIGKGILLAEIQQSSDITCRLYDYNRKDKDGRLRDLHIEDALEAIHYDDTNNGLVKYSTQPNQTNNIIYSPFFVTNFMEIDQPLEKIYADIDSFVIYICLDGKAKITCPEGNETIQTGECILLPASIENVVIYPNPCCKLLETYLVITD
ncbi:MAG: class I mannose-6-phosphate isomerase [Bacteroidales bacterium]|jgi:mannose-6-phosphate isomerase|nr:class I mannose-6-phosphate isomerase [Bacteroidales bacterium]